MTTHDTKAEEIIEYYKPDLIKAIKAFRSENNNDPHIQAIDTTRNQNMQRLEITFQRWLSAEQRNKLEQHIKK